MPTEDPFLTEVARIIVALEAVVDGGLTAAERAAAPYLEAWMPVMRGDMPALRGRVGGHPDLSDTDIVTSDLMHLDVARGIARTRSRWYRLGTRVARPTMDADLTAADPVVAHAARAARSLGLGVWAADDADLQSMLDGWPTELLDEVRETANPGVVARLKAVIETWPVQQGRADGIDCR